MDTAAGAAAAAPAVTEASDVASSAAAAPLALAAPTPAPSLAASATPVPRDALAMEHLLASMGLQPGSYQPKVIAQLMEVMQRYTREILEDAQDYCQHRDHTGKATIDVDDIELAVQSRMSESFTSPPPKELLYALAAQRNSIPLPVVPTREGVHLPAERFCLMQPNYRIKTVQRKQNTESKHNN